MATVYAMGRRQSAPFRKIGKDAFRCHGFALPSDEAIHARRSQPMLGKAVAGLFKPGQGGRFGLSCNGIWCMETVARTAIEG